MYPEPLAGPPEDLAAGKVRELLMAVPVPPSQVDVRRTIADVQSRQRRQYAMTTLAVIAVIGAATAVTSTNSDRAKPTPLATTSTTPDPRRSASWLVVPVTGSIASPVALDSAGKNLLVVGSGFPDTQGGGLGAGTGFVKLRWENGVFTQLPPELNGAEVINTSGTLAGARQPGQGQGSLPWIAEGGSRRDLPVPSGYRHAVLAAINARGDVVGTVAEDPGQVERGRPVIWPAGTPGEVRFLDTAGPSDGSTSTVDWVSDIADDGTAVGWSHLVPTVWRPDGTRFSLRLPPGSRSGEVHSLSGGYGYGTVKDPAGTTRTVRWQLSTGKETIFPTVVTKQVKGTSDGRVLDLNAARGPALVSQRGAGELLPLPAGVTREMITFNEVLVSDDGRTIVAGVTRHDNPGGYGLLLWALA